MRESVSDRPVAARNAAPLNLTLPHPPPPAQARTPRRPHSPRDPLDTVWKDTSSTLLAYGSPISASTLRADTNGVTSW